MLRRCSRCIASSLRIRTSIRSGRRLTFSDLDYTLYFGLGSWRGKQGKSIMIELDNVSRCRAEEAAEITEKLND